MVFFCTISAQLNIMRFDCYVGLHLRNCSCLYKSPFLVFFIVIWFVRKTFVSMVATWQNINKQIKVLSLSNNFLCILQLHKYWAFNGTHGLINEIIQGNEMYNLESTLFLNISWNMQKLVVYRLKYTSLQKLLL